MLRRRTNHDPADRTPADPPVWASGADLRAAGWRPDRGVKEVARAGVSGASLTAIRPLRLRYWRLRRDSVSASQSRRIKFIMGIYKRVRMARSGRHRRGGLRMTSVLVWCLT